MNHFLYKLGLRLASRRYVRKAIDEQADLSAFRQPPTFRIVLGMFLLVLSYLICWPVISTLGVLSVYFDQLWIAAMAPVVYVLSHLCFLAGISLTGFEHLNVILRWCTRKGVQRLLSFAPTRQRLTSSPPRPVVAPTPITPSSVAAGEPEG